MADTVADAQVERAAKAAFEVRSKMYEFEFTWETIGAYRRACYLDEARAALEAAAPPPTPLPDTADFKNFHRLICERFGYCHDERDWRRDQISLIEWIAKRTPPPLPVWQDIGPELSLADCPIGLFMCGDELCLKTEYGNNEGRIDAYIVSSGEFFWGYAPQTIARQRATLVRPVTLPAPPPAKDAPRILKDETTEWQTDKADGQVTCHSRMVDGVLCRWWGDGPPPKGVIAIDAAALPAKDAVGEAYERCAKIADAQNYNDAGDYMAGWADCAAQIASDIRLAASSPPKDAQPEIITVATEDRQTFSVPQGYVGERDAEGRSTGRVIRKDAERCIACGIAFNDGDEVYDDTDGGYIHARCSGSDPEGYVDANGAPLKPGDPLPRPWKWAALEQTNAGESDA